MAIGYFLDSLAEKHPSRHYPSADRPIAQRIYQILRSLLPSRMPLARLNLTAI